MTPPGGRRALYYPFHLCHERTLARLLEEYVSVHFRDYMALQLTPMSGTTAFPDRMGDAYPELIAAGRIVQGHRVSGPLDVEAIAAVDRDLSDEVWRALFHAALSTNRQFQRGLLALSHGMLIGGSLVPGPAALLQLLDEVRAHRGYSVRELGQLTECRASREDDYDYEYALALIKTSASLVYTVRLCAQHGLETVTDSEAHFTLLERTCHRDSLSPTNRRIQREGY